MLMHMEAVMSFEFCERISRLRGDVLSGCEQPRPPGCCLYNSARERRPVSMIPTTLHLDDVCSTLAVGLCVDAERHTSGRDSDRVQPNHGQIVCQ